LQADGALAEGVRDIAELHLQNAQQRLDPGRPRPANPGRRGSGDLPSPDGRRRCCYAS